jgi:cytochrome c553
METAARVGSATRAALLLLLLLPAAHAADIAAGKEKAENVCFACHGKDGISVTPDIPSLAGQPDGFIQWQLVYFRSGTRKNELMAPIASQLTDQDIRNLGAYFASLPPPAPPKTDDKPELTKTGAALAAEHRCAACHRDDLSGQQATARLANQREEVLLKALRDFKSGARRGSGVAAMPDVVEPLSDADFVALAHYAAHYR